MSEQPELFGWDNRPIPKPEHPVFRQEFLGKPVSEFKPEDPRERALLKLAEEFMVFSGEMTPGDHHQEHRNRRQCLDKLDELKQTAGILYGPEARQDLLLWIQKLRRRERGKRS